MIEADFKHASTRYTAFASWPRFSLRLPAGAQSKRKKVLAIGEVKGYQHDSVSHALASFERWGKETGLWDTYIRTDTQLITKKKLEGTPRTWTISTR